MKSLKLLVAFSLSITLFGCGIFPFEKSIKEDHLVLENFKIDRSSPKEFISLACFRNRPTPWTQSRELPAGEHRLWVKAEFDIGGEGYVNMFVKLDAGKRYKLNRSVEDKLVSIWIEDRETGVVVSDVLTTELKIPLVVESKIRIEQCKLGSV